MRSGVVDDEIVADIEFWEHTVYGEFIIIFTERAGDIVFVVARLVFFSEYRNVMIRTVHRRTHQVARTGVQPSVFFVNVFLVDTLRHKLSVRAEHEASQLGKDRDVAKTGGNEYFFKFLTDSLADYLNIIRCLVRRVRNADAAGEVDEANVGSGLFL